MMDFKNSFTVIVEDCSSLFQRAYLLPTAPLWFSFFSLLCIPRHYPDRRVLNGINFLRRNDESCVTHSPPQVGVDNLDKYARSFALLYPPRHPNPPRAQTVQLRWPEVSHNKWAAGNNLSLLVMSGTLCVTVRPGLSTLHVNWRQGSMWSSVLQRPESAQSAPHRNKCCPSSCLSTDFHWHLPSW